MKHCGTQELETERLVLRRLSIDDSEMMYNNWACDRQVTQYLRWNAHRSWGETAETLNEWEKHYDDPAFYQWGITDKHTGVLFGTISLFPAPALKMGWHLNTERKADAAGQAEQNLRRGQRHAVGHGLARDAAQLCAGQRRKHGGAVFIPKRNRHNTKT